MNIQSLLSRCQVVPGITSKMVYITPDVATELLALNTHNRKISKAVVDKYVREIENGEWYAVASGVGIDEKLVLSDGQHRLAAVVKSKTIVPLLIVYGLPVAGQQKVDRQNRRTIFDAFSLAGFTDSLKAVQVATCLARRSADQLGAIPADSDIKATLEVYRDSIYAILKRNGGASNKPGLSAAGVLSAMVVAHSRDPERTIEFYDKVAQPTELAVDDPRYRLSKWLREGEKPGGGGSRQRRDFRVTAGCINAYFAGRRMIAVREAEDIII